MTHDRFFFSSVVILWNSKLGMKYEVSPTLGRKKVKSVLAIEKVLGMGSSVFNGLQFASL